MYTDLEEHTDTKAQCHSDIKLKISEAVLLEIKA